MSICKKASLLFLICTLLFLMLSLVFSYFINTSGDLLYLINSIGVSVPAFLIPAIIFRRRERFPAFGAPRFSQALVAVALGFGCVLLNESLTLITECAFFGLRTASNSTTASSLTGLDPAVMIISLVILPPVCEEFIMRGALLESWRRSTPLGAAVLTSLIFGLLHAAPSSLLIYFGIGMVFALIYLITRNVWLTVIAHGVNNLIPVLLSIIRGFGEGGSAAETAVQSRTDLLILAIEFAVYAAMVLVPLMFLLRSITRKHGLGKYSEAVDSLDDGRVFPVGEAADAPLHAREQLMRDAFIWMILFVLTALNVISGLNEFGVIGADAL